MCHEYNSNDEDQFKVAKFSYPGPLVVDKKGLLLRSSTVSAICVHSATD